MYQIVINGYGHLNILKHVCVYKNYCGSLGFFMLKKK